MSTITTTTITVTKLFQCFISHVTCTVLHYTNLKLHLFRFVVQQIHNKLNKWSLDLQYIIDRPELPTSRLSVALINNTGSAHPANVALKNSFGQNYCCRPEGPKLLLFYYETLPILTSFVVSLTKATSTSAMTERPREFGDFKGMGHFEAKC